MSARRCIPGDTHEPGLGSLTRSIVDLWPIPRLHMRLVRLDRLPMAWQAVEAPAGRPMSSLQPMMKKYPRTRHLETSRFQHGDHDLEAVAFKDVRGQFLVVEEKMDGANAGISFDAEGRLLLQSRGHYLAGGPRERHFDLFKRWAHGHAEDLYLALGDRYIMYGEWMYAKHTCFYDALPAYFMEFDLYDRERDLFLSTARRRQLLAGLPVVSVAVLWEGRPQKLSELTKLNGPSRFKTPAWRERLVEAGAAAGVPAAQVLAETDGHDAMEGLYIKVEDDERVLDRLKWVRPSFLSALADSGSHWLDRPIVVNRLIGDRSAHTDNHEPSP